GAVSGKGWLMFEREYADFELELEYKLPTAGNSGVLVHAWPDGSPDSAQFLEIQLLDDDAPAFRGLEATRKTGGVYGGISPKPPAKAPANEWNKLRIRSVGRQLAVQVNGQQVVDANLDQYSDHFDRMPGLKRDHGRIGLQTFGTLAEFRNIRVREL